MKIPQAVQLSELIHRKVADFIELCEGLDEETASRSTTGRWSPKEIVSHLCGPEGIGHMPTIYAILERETPTLEIEVENPFFTEDRGRKTFAELLGEFEREYDHIANFVAGLSEEQLDRKAHMPFLRETGFGEYPTLAVWIQLIGEYHLGSHTDHMRKILEALGVRPGISGKQASQKAHVDLPSSFM